MSNLTIQEINAAIIGGNFTNEQLESVNDAVRYARSRITAQTVRKLRVNDKVSFVHSRNGLTYTGKVAKVNPKFIRINCGASGMWRVPANMLTVQA